jgi:hypothetical protein
MAPIASNSMQYYPVNEISHHLIMASVAHIRAGKRLACP